MFEKFFDRIKSTRRRKVAILMYHQVCDKPCDPWQLAVHPDRFQAQLEYLAKNFNVVPVSSLAHDGSGNHAKKTVAISFDDGFRDNYTNAAPLLDWKALPATFYMTTAATRPDHVYWWDALEDAILHSEVLPVRLNMIINGLTVKFTFRCDRRLTEGLTNQIRRWNYNMPISNERIALYMLLWHHMRPLGYEAQNAVMTTIREWAGHTKLFRDQRLTMSVREMRMLSENPLFTLGAHSVHHAMLSKQNSVDQAYEINESKNQLEKWTGKEVTGFSYPYGNYNETTQAILREAGFRYAVSTEARAICRNDDRFALPRIAVGNWTVNEFASKINNMIHE